MKNIETIVISLETSRKMYEIGIDFGETVFCYVLKDNKFSSIKPTREAYSLLETNSKLKIISAPTTDEIWRMLPTRIIKNKTSYYIILSKDGDGHSAAYENPMDIDNIIIRITNLKSAEALAELCMWCKEEGYV